MQIAAKWDRYTLRLRLNIAQRLLESELASIIRTMNGHKERKLKQNAAEYVSLWKSADHKIEAFCNRYPIDRVDIEAQLPAIRELKLLAQPAPEANRKAQGFGLIAGVLLGVLILGFVTGLFHWLFTTGYNWAPK